MFLILFIFSGCRIDRNQFRMPEKQFVYIVKNAELYACHKKTEVCLLAEKGHGYASGFLVAHRGENSFYLTAGHVCEKEVESENKEFDAKLEFEIHLYDYDQEDLIASIIAINTDYDMCLLKTKKVNHIPAIIAEKDPRQHTPVINVAAPAGVWTKESMLHFEGEFQGNRIKKSVEQSMYTLTAQPGSSGSAIYDPLTGKVVGIVTHVLGPSYGVAFGPTTAQIRSFLRVHMPK